MFLIFFALWLIFNAKFTLEICIFGIVLSALMYLFIWKVFGYKPKYDWLMVKLSLRGIKYFVILIWEIIKANIAVLKLIFTPKVEVNWFILKWIWKPILQSFFLQTPLH